MFSLAKHPDARLGGEVFCDAVPAADWSDRASCQRLIDKSNLFKLMSIYRHRKHFDLFDGWGCVIYLYRQDIEAQLASWRKACESGQWVAGWRSIEPMEYQMERAIESIKVADAMFLRRADLAISYETLVDKWDASVAMILAAAGWPQQTLEQATEKTA